MACYFFDTHDGHHLVTDEDGLELDGPSSIKREALSALADMAKDKFPCNHLDRMFVSVRDAGGKVVFRATVSLTIEESLEKPS